MALNSDSLKFPVVNPNTRQSIPYTDGFRLLFQVDTWVLEYREGPDETDTQGLHTKTVGLNFQIQNEHFIINGEGVAARMEIRCTSTVGGLTRQKSVFPTLARGLTSNKLAQNGYRNSAGKMLLRKRTAEM